MSGTVYSIGTKPMFNINQLLATLRMYGITVVFDVRNISEIKKTPGMSKMEIKELCPYYGIRYIDAANGLSMDGVDKKYLHSKGYVNYDKYVSSLAFQTQCKQLKEYADEGNTVALMGYQETVSKCHRFFISSELLKQGVDVQHIGPGLPTLHSELEKEEVASAFPVLDHIMLFEVTEEPFESKLQKTLKILNKTIGEEWLKEAPL